MLWLTLVGALHAGRYWGCFDSCLTCLFVLKPNACFPVPNKRAASDGERGPTRAKQGRSIRCSRIQLKRIHWQRFDAGSTRPANHRLKRMPHQTRCAQVSQRKGQIIASLTLKVSTTRHRPWSRL